MNCKPCVMIRNAIENQMWLSVFRGYKLLETMTEAELRETLAWSDSENMPCFTKENIQFVINYFGIKASL